ncbi:ParD-like family protein [Massilia sp. IC2-477]|uniref:ParD-like family protein n=1 Tax=unclassified Massilia TaxID=2609279 RepID=UPI001D0F8B52|nr:MULTISPECIES: ParD-like family protein [unclassified Massilia]MCC2954057.1 ParD-like family protein [Massilia sp. IC2-477]MCC2971487.1 ParD-like family protein [Massilia sp. IC2-476]
MGIVNIDDEVHDQIRKASSVSCRSINAQAAFWIKVGMLCEMNPTLSFNELVARELKAAGVAPEKVRVAGGVPEAVKVSAA